MPVAAGLEAVDPGVAQVGLDVLAAVRRAKSEAKRSAKAPVVRIRVTDTPDRLPALRLVATDLLAAASAVDAEVELVRGDGFAVLVELAAGPGTLPDVTA